MTRAYASTRCLAGRTMRHDPQPDDPSLETDIGQCEECDGDGCEGEDVRAPADSTSEIVTAILLEVSTADANWPGYNSAHEGFAVLAEEVDELWDHVKVNQKRRDLDAMRKECIQVAACAIRFARDICTEERGRK